MGDQAWVESFEALKRLRTALCRFAEVVSAGMGEADAELQRAREWLRSERSSYWKEEGRKRGELLIKAKVALAGKKAQSTPLGGRPSCIEEEKELARAMRRVEEAERKLANVHHWRLRLDEEFFSYQTVASGLSQALAVDIPNALAQLDNMLTALEAYAATGGPEVQGSTAATGMEAAAEAGTELGSMARPAPAWPHEVGDYQRLRARTPSPALRDAAPLARLSEDWRLADGVKPTWLEVPARLGLGRVPVDAEDKIVLARGAAQQSRIYLERLAAVSAGDSGWYVGGIDDAAAGEHDAARMADVLAMRPDFAMLLELPRGFLIVLDGAELEAVLDAEDKRLWPANAGPP